jgi:5'-3' exoribonuclease 1
LLPKCYYENFIKNPKFEKFYPLTFDMDLNGRSMPWEAIVLIPFIDEKQLLEHEEKLKEEGKLVMEQKDIDRNMRGYEKMYSKNVSLSSFPIPNPEFKGFDFGAKNKCKVIEQDPESEDYVGKYYIDYKTTDPEIVVDFPSMRSLPISKVALLPRMLKGTRFVIPQIYIDFEHNKDIDLEKLAKDFVKKERDAIYVDYPFKHEAFIYNIITQNQCYNVFESWLTGKLNKIETPTTDQQWYEATSFANRALVHSNLQCQKLDVIVGFNRVIGIKWNELSQSYDKDYKVDVEYLPIQLISLERNEDHYLNLDPRIKSPLCRFKPNKN